MNEWKSAYKPVCKGKISATTSELKSLEFLFKFSSYLFLLFTNSIGQFTLGHCFTAFNNKLSSSCLVKSFKIE